MDKYSIGILGGLIGSILTVIVNKIIEIFQERKKHVYDLQKHFFIKKLNAAEALVMQCNMVSEAFSQLVILYQKYNLNDNYISREINENLWNQIESKIESANNASSTLASSISLYFDLKFDFDNDEIITDFYDSLHALGPFAENIDIKFQEYSDSIGKENEKDAYNSYLNTQESLKKAMKLTSEKWHIFNDALIGIVLQLRKEMKKYDY